MAGPSPSRAASRPPQGDGAAGQSREDKMKRTSWLFAALSVAVAIVAASTAFAADSVKIGVLMPLTGNAGAAGQASKAAIEVATDIVNNAHPELGLPLAAGAGLPHLGGAKLDVVFV